MIKYLGRFYIVIYIYFVNKRIQKKKVVFCYSAVNILSQRALSGHVIICKAANIFVKRISSQDADVSMYIICFNTPVYPICIRYQAGMQE